MKKTETHQHKWLALLGVSILAFTAFLDATIVNTALPFIQNALHTTILQLQWVANIFTIVLSMTMIAMGKLADKWGRIRVFYVGILFFAVAAIGAGFSQTIGYLVFFRGLQAIGASIIFVVAAALLSNVFPKENHVKAISIYGGVTGFGLMIGPFLGGVLIALLDWRWVFWINIPLIIVGVILCSFSIKGKSHETHNVPVDFLGLLLLIVGLGSLMYGIIESARTDWSSALGWSSFCLGILGLVALILIDSKKERGLLDLHIFKHPLITLASLSCALAGVISTVFMFFDPLYLRILRHLSPLLIGCLIAIIPTAQGLLSFCFSYLVHRFGAQRLLFAAILAGVLAIVLHLFLQVNTSLYFLILPFFLLGITWGLSNSAMMTAINQVIPPLQIGAAIGTIATIWNVSGAIILAISTAIFHKITLEHKPFLPAFHASIICNILFGMILLIAASFCLYALRKKAP